MKNGIAAVIVFLTMLAWGFYPVAAQQASPPGVASPPQMPGSPQPSIPPGSFITPEGGQSPTQYQGGTSPLMPSIPTRQQGGVVLQGQGVLQPRGGIQDALRQQIPQELGSPKTLVPQPSATPVPMEPPSPIEAAFRNLTTVRAPAGVGDVPTGLNQFGYSLFAGTVSTFAPVEDVPVGPDYVLGPGDDLRIYIWGALENALVQTVDRNGQIYLPNVGPLRVWGLTFTQADRVIREELSRYFRGFQTSVTMGRLRTIRIYVVGEVRQPGSFTISSLSTVTNGLFAAGGPLKLGSLRNIQLKRNQHTIGTLDLYDFLLSGDKTRDFRLESGDTIFVPPIGPVAAITGEVKRPAIYELRGPTRISDLIEMAGGLTPQSYLKRVQVIRAKPNAEREVMDLDLTVLQGDGDSPMNIELRNGDLVKIYPTDPRIYNTITLAGSVKHPGDYELKSGMRISQLLPIGSLLPEAYLDGVEVIRFKEDLSTEVLHVNLKKAWAGDETQNISLRPRDQITVRSEFRDPWTVVLDGEVKRPGTYTIKQGERLSSILKRAGGFTDKAYLKGAVFTRESVKRIEEEQLKSFLKSQEERLLAQAGRIDIVGADKEQISQNQQTLAAQRELLRSLASRISLGRLVVRLDDLEKFENSPSDIILENGDKLFIPPKPSSIAVLGAVRSPASLLYKEGEGVEFYVNRAGGLTKQADEKEIYIAKADGSAITGFTKLRKIEPGDAIIVPPKEEERVRWLAVSRDWATILGQTMISIAALAAIF